MSENFTVESITDEVKREKIAVESEIQVNVDNNGELSSFQVANFNRRSETISRFEFLLDVIARGTTVNANQENNILQQREIISQLKGENERLVIGNALTPEGVDLRKLNANQAKELRKAWEERDELKAKFIKSGGALDTTYIKKLEAENAKMKQALKDKNEKLLELKTLEAEFQKTAHKVAQFEVLKA
jgi:hypothetical protein